MLRLQVCCCCIRAAQEPEAPRDSRSSYFENILFSLKKWPSLRLSHYWWSPPKHKCWSSSGTALSYHEGRLMFIFVAFTWSECFSWVGEAELKWLSSCTQLSPTGVFLFMDNWLYANRFVLSAAFLYRYITVCQLRSPTSVRSTLSERCSDDVRALLWVVLLRSWARFFIMINTISGLIS